MPPRRPGSAPSGSGVTRSRARYRRIIRFAARNLAVTWWYEVVLPRFGLAKVAERTRAGRMRRFAKRFHTLAVELGGLMIKVGQFMSSRLDVLPPEITRELEGLQDEVPAVPAAAIRARAEEELGVALAEVFASVEETPVAAASLGQAHRAVLVPEMAAEVGFDRVILKVQRPEIAEIVAVDLAALREVGGWLSKVRLVSRRVDMPALVEEFAVTSLEEIDYLNEAANAERFGADFADDPRVSVPAVVWERTSRRVLTLEDVTAIKITDHEGLRAAGIDPVEVANVFAEVSFDQLFNAGFFHADPHPGNVFVTPTPGTGRDPAWTLTFIDFGMMGEVPAGTRAGLRRLLIAAASRDGSKLVEAIQGLGVLLPDADTRELERAMTQLLDRFGGMGFADLRDVDPREFREFAVEFGDVIRSLPFQLPENFLLIGRAVSLVSGVCSALDPEFNLWDPVEPYAAQLLQEESGGMLVDLAQEAVGVLGTLWRLPTRFDSFLDRVEDGSFEVAVPELERQLGRLETSARRAVSAVIFGALLIAGAVLHAADVWLGGVFMTTSVLPLLHAVLAGRFR